MLAWLTPRAARATAWAARVGGPCRTARYGHLAQAGQSIPTPMPWQLHLHRSLCLSPNQDDDEGHRVADRRQAAERVLSGARPEPTLASTPYPGLISALSS